MYKVEVLYYAWNDLRDIGRYISKDNPAAANRIRKKLIASLERLKTFPLSAPLIHDAELSREGYRTLRCGKYLCVYRVVDKTAFVYRFVHSARDYSATYDFLNSMEYTKER
jgi:plasmid stabilization system protein ParE